MAIKFMGREGYAKTVEHQIELTKYLAQRIDELTNFKRVGEVETAVCCFRVDGIDRLQQRLQQIIERSGEAWLTTTVLHGRRAMRVNVNSFLTEKHHIDGLVELLQRAERTLSGES
jgi:aromatic-L-amino-acid decarboxylase